MNAFDATGVVSQTSFDVRFIQESSTKLRYYFCKEQYSIDNIYNLHICRSCHWGRASNRYGKYFNNFGDEIIIGKWFLLLANNFLEAYDLNSYELLYV